MKQYTQHISTSKVASVSRSRFDKPQPNSPEKAEIAVVVAAQGHTNDKTVRYVDTSIPQEDAIQSLQLPAHTLYLIDKVVRQKAMAGPIGVDNSEVINIEQERELRRKNRKLYHSKDDDEENETE
jgi:hypothetical protein